MPDLLPAPWISGTSIERRGDWTAFRAEAIDAYRKRLCAVCGERTGKRILLGVYNLRKRLTSGPGGHPRCMWLALNTCPHLVELSREQPVAWEYVGDGPGHVIDPEHTDDYGAGERVVDEARPVTYEQARVIARLDPLGDGRDIPGLSPHDPEKTQVCWENT